MKMTLMATSSSDLSKNCFRKPVKLKTRLKNYDVILLLNNPNQIVSLKRNRD